MPQITDIIHTPDSIWNTKPLSTAMVKPKANHIERAADELVNAVINYNAIDRIQTGLEHHQERHVNMTISDMIDRVLSRSDPTTHASTFFPGVPGRERAGMIRELSENAILDNAEKIVRWLDDRKAPSRLAIAPEPSGEPVGDGVRLRAGKLTHLCTDRTCVILQKDNGNPYNPYNFRIVTMYPDIAHENAKPTGLDLMPRLRKSATYQEAGSYRRRSLEHMVRLPQQPNRPVRTKPLPVLSKQTSNFNGPRGPGE